MLEAAVVATILGLAALGMWIRAIGQSKKYKAQRDEARQVAKNQQKAINELGPVPTTDAAQLEWLRDDDI